MTSTPPPLPPRPPTTNVEESLVLDKSADETDAVERELSEQQLRDLYDSEEIDRFLSLFSAYVTDVQLHDIAPPLSRGVDGKFDVPISNNGSTVNLSPTDIENQDWDTIGASEVSRPPSPPSLLSGPPTTKTVSEAIAARYLTPLLPMTPLPPPLFTLGRLRLTTQRLYLVIQPTYGPFFVSLVDLAEWKDKPKSSIYCAVFWILWYQNLLLPCLFLRIFYSIIRRRLFSYPTLAEMRAHRQEIDRANEFGQEISARFSASSSLGMKELWRLFKVFNKSKKSKVKKFANSQVRDRALQEGPMDDGDTEQEVNTVLDSDNTKEDSKENDVKRALLAAMSEIADLHERVKNIFIWRRPASSRTYSIALFFLFLLTLLMPAKYIAKLTYFVGGLLFWHVVPVIAALPQADRARLPPAFADVPTDAEYAMELISQRVAAGLDVIPARSTRAKKNDKNEQEVADDIAKSDSQRQKQDKDVNWKKWGERAAIGMTWAEDGKRLFTATQTQNSNRASIVATGGSSFVQTHTFPAQHTSAPGLITLTPSTLFFTPLMSSNPKIEMTLSDLRRVKKKSGIFTALSIRWMDVDGNLKEEKFRWVGGRDELFARLVGTTDGKRWIQA
ncbi:hypothetical protein B0H10DRAFT_973230 [Mycena sp. CBHHK59/15]|nr:hypothetical protein B0H10DRAFT_973230 [Mycena sp. CBHHK59/15]